MQDIKDNTMPKDPAIHVRLSFNVSPALHKKANKIPWGIRAAILRTLLERIIDAAEEHGQEIYGAVMSGEFKIVGKK